MLKSDSAFFKPSGARSQSDLMVSSVLHLMSHYTAHGNELGVNLNLATVIERHLQELANAQELAPVLRTTCRQLVEQWAHMAQRTAPQPTRVGIWARLFAQRDSV